MYNYIHISRTGGTSIQKVLEDVPEINYLDVGTRASDVENTIVILRDPADRFKSAYWDFYSVPKWSKDIQDLFDSGVTTPNDLAETMAREEPSELLSLAKGFIHDTPNAIGGQRISMKWEFYPQENWVSNPAYTLLFEEMNESFPVLVKKLTGRTVTVPHLHPSPRPKSEKLSPLAMEWIHKTYREDYKLRSALNGN